MPSRRLPFLAVAFCATAVARAGDMQVLFPLYSYPDWYSPSTYIWKDVAAAASTVPVTAIINPNSGPGGPPNADYIQGMSDLQAGGVTMIGYVDTAFGDTSKRPISAVEQDINTYDQSFRPYGVTGIFLDDASTDPSTLSYYTTIYNYIKTQTHLTAVFTNPGTNIPQSFVSAPTSDTTVIFEDTVGWSSYQEDSYVQSYAKQRFAAIMLNVPTIAQMHADLDLAEQRNVGYVFVTDATTPNPYDRLPSYWTDEIQYIASIPEPGALALLLAAAPLVLRRLRRAPPTRE